MNTVTKNWLAFLFGLGSVTEIRIVGALGITEAICIFLSPFVFMGVWPIFRQTIGKKILLFLFLWFLSAIATDLYRESSVRDTLRGVFVLPFVFSAFIISFALLWDDLTRVRWMAVGIAISGIISIFMFRSQTLIANAAGMGVAVEDAMNFRNYYVGIVYNVIAALVVFIYRKKPNITVYIILIASVLFLVGGARGVFLTLLFSTGATWIARRQFLSLRIIQRSLIMVVVFVGVVGSIAMKSYAYSAEQGWLGEEAYKKYKQQSESDLGLLSGRSEFIASILAIKDSPFLGHGSWPMDTKNYGVRMLEYQGRYRDARLRSYIVRTYGACLPAHSHLWQAWVWHGFFGGIFWIYVITLMYRFSSRAIHLCRPLIAYNILLLTSGLWDLLFSPFAGRPRWGMLFTIFVLGLAEVARRRRRNQIDRTVDINAPWDGRWTERTS